MTTYYLIRHASVDSIGNSLAGRQAGIDLNDQGRQEAHVLADQMACEPLEHIYCSPLERTRNTAHVLADRLGLQVTFVDELIELDFGNWTGRSFDELDSDPKWQPFNSYRSGTRIPEGELLLEVQSRIVSFMLRLRDESPNAVVALVSHGDVIRSALAYFLGMPIDLLTRIEVGPASISIVRLHQNGAEIQAINVRAIGMRP